VLGLCLATVLQHRLVLGLEGVPPLHFVLPACIGVLFGLIWARALSGRDDARDTARRDPLTGASNRMAFDEALDNELGRANRYGHPFGVLMFDIDHFKRINDLDGHHVGDEVLRELAAVVRSVLRSTDLICRWGGDEFAVIAPATGLPGARVLAEKIRTTVQDHRWSVPGISLTVSVGMAQFVVGDQRDTIMNRADEALYRAKRAGRNQAATMRCLRPANTG